MAPPGRPGPRGRSRRAGEAVIGGLTSRDRGASARSRSPAARAGASAGARRGRGRRRRGLVRERLGRLLLRGRRGLLARGHLARGPLQLRRALEEVDREQRRPSPPRRPRAAASPRAAGTPRPPRAGTRAGAAPRPPRGPRSPPAPAAGSTRWSSATVAAQGLELAPALGTALEVRVDQAPLVRGEGLVQIGRQRVARLVAGHGRNRSSFSFRSARARCRRERTVPSSRSSTCGDLLVGEALEVAQHHHDAPVLGQLGDGPARAPSRARAAPAPRPGAGPRRTAAAARPRPVASAGARRRRAGSGRGAR